MRQPCAPSPGVALIETGMRQGDLLLTLRLCSSRSKSHALFGGPMSYIKHVLQPGETVRYQGSVQWILYLPAIKLGVVGLVSSLFGPPGWVIAAICFLMALILALRAWFIRWMTEIVVTDR